MDGGQETEHGAGAMAGLRVVLGICNSKQDPSTPELGLLLGLHTQPPSCSASALLSTNWCNSHLNKLTCAGDCKPEPLAPASIQCEECAVLPPPAIVTCPTPPQTPPHGEEEKRFLQFILMKFECLKHRHESPCKDFQTHWGKGKLCHWLWFRVLL